MRTAALLLIFVCTAALATTYRWVDANGVVHYSDTPGPGAQKIDLPEAQTYRAPPVPAATAPAVPPRLPAVTYSCAIAQPASEATLFELEAVTVSVNVQPGLRSGDTVSVSFDGMTIRQASPDSLEFRISPIDRGAHTVSATVSDADSKTVCTSAPVTFYVRQPSVLSPQAPPRAR